MAKPAKDIAEIRAEAEAAQVEETARLDLRIARLRHRGQLATVLAGVQEAEEAASWSRRDRRWNRRKARWSARVAPSVSAVVYAGAVGTAVDGQMSTAEHLFGWHWYAGAGMAGFVELVALAAAKTAHDTRLEAAEQGLYEPALFPRALAWAGAAFAAAVNAYAHEAIPLEAAVLGAASLVGIVVWEMRNSWPLRKALLAKNLVPAHLPRLGAKYAIRFPIQALDAKSASIEDPAVSTRDEAISAGAVRRSRRHRFAVRLTVWGWWRTDGRTITGRTDDHRTDAVDGRTVTMDERADDHTPVAVDDGSAADGRTDIEARTDGPSSTRTDQHGTDGWTVHPSTDGPSNGAASDRPEPRADSPSMDGLVDRSEARDYLAMVRPTYRHMVGAREKVTRDSLGLRLRAAGISVPNGTLGGVLRVLRAELPPGAETSPEPARAAG